MVDTSKHTEEEDISRSDFTETITEETMRNLNKNQQQDIHMQIRRQGTSKFGTGDQSLNSGYQNLKEEDNLQSIPVPLNVNMMKAGSELSKTIGEVEKSMDQIYKQNDDYYGYEEEEKNPRAHTDGGGYSQRDYNQDHSFQDDSDQKRKKNQNNQNKIGSISMKQHLPYLKLNVPLSLTTSDIFEIFVNISKKERFQVIEMEQTIATAVNKEPFSIKRMFMRCIPFQEFKKDQATESFISAIRLQLSVNEVKCCRKIALKGLYGENNRLQEFVQSFRAKIHEVVSKLPESKSQRKLSSQSFNSIGAQSAHSQTGAKRKSTFFQTTLGSKRNNNMSDDDSDSESKHGAFNETSSLYQIHKILSSDQYTLGKNVAHYIESFHLQYKSLRESAELLPQPIEGLMGLVNETVHAFNSEYNLGKEQAKSLMGYCRPTVEKYIFSKLYDKLFAMYAIKNEAEDRLFNERRQLIKKMKPYDIMIYLGISEKFIIQDQTQGNQYTSSRTSYVQLTDQSKFSSIQRESLDPFKQAQDISQHFDTQRSDQLIVQNRGSQNKNEESIFNNSSTSSSLHFGGLVSSNNVASVAQGLAKNELPYFEAIKCFEKIQQYTSPREKLSCISESFGCLKTAIVDYWKGKVELNTMDDVLPLTIYCVSMAELSHPASELNLMEDYLRIHERGFELERKLLTNFDVSIRYINHEWQINQ